MMEYPMTGDLRNVVRFEEPWHGIVGGFGGIGAMVRGLGDTAIQVSSAFADVLGSFFTVNRLRETIVESLAPGLSRSPASSRAGGLGTRAWQPKPLILLP